MENNPQRGSAKLRPRASIVRVLGDELISDDTVALTELVKNAYDADATPGIFVEVCQIYRWCNDETFYSSLRTLESLSTKGRLIISSFARTNSSELGVTDPQITLQVTDGSGASQIYSRTANPALGPNHGSDSSMQTA